MRTLTLGYRGWGMNSDCRVEWIVGKQICILIFLYVQESTSKSLQGRQISLSSDSDDDLFASCHPAKVRFLVPLSTKKPSSLDMLVKWHVSRDQLRLIHVYVVLTLRLPHGLSLDCRAFMSSTALTERSKAFYQSPPPHCSPNKIAKKEDKRKTVCEGRI